jgi:hypothetical protein
MDQHSLLEDLPAIERVNIFKVHNVQRKRGEFFTFSEKLKEIPGL